MASDRFFIRAMEVSEWDQVATLIHDSTNAWYVQRGFPAIFGDGPQSTRLFCEVYESLDAGCCLVAEDRTTGRLAGSCCYHPRPTHVSLGIMNVHPDCFGLGVASILLQAVTDVADNPGTWQFHYPFGEHMESGMTSLFHVPPEEPVENRMCRRRHSIL